MRINTLKAILKTAVQRSDCSPPWSGLWLRAAAGQSDCGVHHR